MPWNARIVGSVLNFLDARVYRKDGTVNRKLQSRLDKMVPASSKPVNGISTEDVVIDTTNNVWVRVFKPAPPEEAEGEATGENKEHSRNSERKLPVIMYYHGGGFVGLSADHSTYDKFCRQVAKACGAVLISVNYRRAPEFPYPAAYDDCYQAFEWLRSPDARRDHLPAAADISQCFVAGDSAGGNIVHFMGCRAAENDISPIKLRGMVELQPFFGGEESTPSEINLKPPILPLTTSHWAWRAFLPGENRDHPASNVLGPNSPDISHLSLPPILVVTGSLDILQDRQARYIEKLQEMGKEVTVKKYTGGYHAFYILGLSDLADKAMADVYDFILSRTIQ